MMNDEKIYLIAVGESWRIWNNGVVECKMSYNSSWMIQNSYQNVLTRQRFIEMWRDNCEIGKWYETNWHEETMFVRINEHSKFQKFLGFREDEKCTSCNVGNVIWNNGFLCCTECKEVHGISSNDDESVYEQS